MRRGKVFHNKEPMPEKKSEQLKKQLLNGIFHTGTVALAAGISIAAICVAWFVNNTKVQAGMAAVSAQADWVELRSTGGGGIHDDLLKKLMQTDGGSYSLPTDGAASQDTSPEKPSVNWLLQDDSNLGNYGTVPGGSDNSTSSWEAYWQNSKNKRKDQAIEPGTSGHLQFSLVPKNDGTITVDLQLNLLPYLYASTSKTQESDSTSDTLKAVDDPFLRNFVQGHIMLFLETETDPTGTDSTDAQDQQNAAGKYIQWLADGRFSITIENAQKDKEYPYTLYWCWPQNFAQYTLAQNSAFLNGYPILFYAKDTSAAESASKFSKLYNNSDALREDIAHKNKYSMVNAPQRYFYSNLTSTPLEKGQSELGKITAIYNHLLPNNTGADTSNTDAENAFINLSSYYNQADQYIGGHANCLLVRLEIQ